MAHRHSAHGEQTASIPACDNSARQQWYEACDRIASALENRVPPPYRKRTFSGIIGDIKALTPRQALSLYSRKKGIGLQYATQYLRTGIDHGRGYQACAATALDTIAGPGTSTFFGGKILDVGCAVGVTAGVLGLEHVVGFDLFGDLLQTAREIDELTETCHRYITADMTRMWPFSCVFDTVVCGLVCHHLKSQESVARFFRSANRVLKPGGSLIITLPAGSIATVAQFHRILEGLTSYGFECNHSCSGLVRSDDDPHALFWMFLICAQKRSEPQSGPFIDPEFSFTALRTPVPRTIKGERARKTVQQTRKVQHDRFRLIDAPTLFSMPQSDKPLVFETVRKI